MVYPTTMGFPTKNDHFGVFGGYHHLRKHPYSGFTFFQLNSTDVAATNFGPDNAMPSRGEFQDLTHGQNTSCGSRYVLHQLWVTDKTPVFSYTGKNLIKPLKSS